MTEHKVVKEICSRCSAERYGWLYNILPSGYSLQVFICQDCVLPTLNASELFTNQSNYCWTSYDTLSFKFTDLCVDARYTFKWCYLSDGIVLVARNWDGATNSFKFTREPKTGLWYEDVPPAPPKPPRSFKGTKLERYM